MTFIVGKKQDGKTYYYLAESARVDGKPRIVSQRYLGSAEEIAQRLSESGPGEPDRSRHLAFGDIAAVWEMLARLQVAEIIDEVVGARRSDAGASIGTYIALATLNRVVDPCSKLAFSEWWAKTAGDRWLRLPPGALDHRRFWEAMDAIDEDDLREIERRIVAAMVETFALDLSGLVLDMTNFATWIDSGNEKAPIAQRGHSKQKRNDLLTELVTVFSLVRASRWIGGWVMVLAHGHCQRWGAQGSRDTDRAGGGVVGCDRRPLRALPAG